MAVSVRMCDAASCSRVMQPEDRQRRYLSQGLTGEFKSCSPYFRLPGLQQEKDKILFVVSDLALGATPRAEIRLLGILSGLIFNGACSRAILCA